MSDSNTGSQSPRQRTSRLLHLLTQTPMHVGAGFGPGAVDRPIQRERPTGFPVIPGPTLKGALAAAWLEAGASEGDPAGMQRDAQGRWLFGDNRPGQTAPSRLHVSEARLLAFPVRSARGGFAWVTCPLILRRYARDGGLAALKPDGTPNHDLLPRESPRDHQALFHRQGILALGDRIVLEDYTLFYREELPPQLPGALQSLLPADPVWTELSSRLVLVSDSLLSYLVQTACEVVQHAALDAGSGAVRAGSIYSQENVPAETMFYARIMAREEAEPRPAQGQARGALDLFRERMEKGGICQVGGDASTGHGLCSVAVKNPVA